MKLIKLLFFLTLSLSLKAQDTYVLVHGAWGGGWQWKNVDSLLTEMGHEVYRPTLTGLGEKVHLASKDVNLTTHINDVVNTIIFEELENVVLLGHSYGGMVVTGVAERIPERIKRIIYLDALYPENGESLFDAMQNGNSNGLLAMEKDGFLIPPWVEDGEPYPTDVPHPMATLSEKLKLVNEKRLLISGDYILTVEENTEMEDDTFYKFYLRAEAANLAMKVFEGGHNPHWFKAKELLPLLLD